MSIHHCQELQTETQARRISYAVCPRCHTDLALIEEGWSYPKDFVKKRPHWDDELVRELAHEGWDNFPQKWINEMVNRYPQLLQDCIDSKGQMVARRR